MRLSRLLAVVPGTASAQPSGAPASCRCGHVTLAHEHYRRGSDCALCPCARYRRLPAGQVAQPLPVRHVPARVVTAGGAHEQSGAA